MTTTEARFICTANHHRRFNGGEDYEVTLMASTAPEWTEYTPAGDIRVVIQNPAAAANFNPGKTYKVTFEEVDQE